MLWGFSPCFTWLFCTITVLTMCAKSPLCELISCCVKNKMPMKNANEMPMTTPGTCSGAILLPQLRLSACRVGSYRQLTFREEDRHFPVCTLQ